MKLTAAPLPTERQVQRSILSMMGVCFRDVYVTAIPNGAYLSGNEHQRRIQGGCLVGDGMKKGFPDLLCLWKPWRGALIEVKRPEAGRLSPDQVKVHEILRALDWPIRTCDNTEDAYNFLRESGAPCSCEWQREPF